MEDCETGVLTSTRRRTKERDYKPQGHRFDVGGVEVVRILHCSSSGKEKQPESWKKLHVGGIEGISQPLQVMMTKLLQKHWEWQEDRTAMLRHGSIVRSTMYAASLDIKTAFDEARPRHVAKLVESHNTQKINFGPPAREDQAMFECVESKVSFDRCLRRGSVEAPRLRQKMAMQLLAILEENWVRKRMGVLSDLEGQRAHQMCSFTWADNFWIMSHSKNSTGTDAEGSDSES